MLAKHTTLLMLTAFFLLFFCAENASAVTYGPYKVFDNTATTQVTLYDGTCRNIATSGVGNTIMVPTNSAAEWTAFSTNKPAGVTISATTCRRTWLGAVDANWSTPGNWSDSTVPTAADIAVFDSTCTANCGAVTMDVNVSVLGVIIETNFPSNLTLTANAVTVAVGTQGWIQRSTNTFAFAGTNATSITNSGPLTLNTGTFTSCSGTNTYSGAVTIAGGTLAGGTNTVTISGSLTVSSGSYTSSTGTNTFSGGVALSGGSITSGSALTVNGAVTQSGGTWTLASGGASSFNGVSGTTTVSAGTLTVPNAASTTTTFGSTLTISGTGKMTVGAAATLTTTGLLTVSSTTANAYSSGGTDVFNGGVTLSGSGGMTTGPSMNERGAVSISAGTWTLTSGTNNFNNDNATGVTITGGTLLPAGTVGFNGTGTSLTMNGGTFGTAGTTGTLNFGNDVTLTPSSGNVVFHNGTATVNVTGTLLMTSVSGSSNTCSYGDGSAATNTFGAMTMTYKGSSGATSNPTFTQGATNLVMSSFTMNATTSSGSRGAVFASGATGSMTVNGAAGSFNFDCTQGGGNGNKFNGTSGTLQLDVPTIAVKASGSCDTGASQFAPNNSNLVLTGGTQTINNTITSFTVKSLAIGFNAASKTKTINPGLTVTNGVTISDSGFSTSAVTFASTLTANGTGTALTETSTGSLAITNTGAISLPNGDMEINSSSGAVTITDTGGITIGSTTASSLTLNPTGTGTIALNGPGSVTIYKDLISTDTASRISGNSPIVMAGATAANITLAGSGNIGVTGAFTIAKSTAATTVSIQSTPQNINTVAQNLNITTGTLQLNPASGACSGATVCTLNAYNINIPTGGSLVCGNGNVTIAGTLTVTGTGIINCTGHGFNWVGTGGNTNWNNAANWSGGVVPGPSDVAVFNNTFCGANCNATINTAQTVGGVSMHSGYTGTITQSANLTVGFFAQIAGTFTGGAFTFSDSGDFIVSGGTFNPPSGTTTFNATTAATLTFPATTFAGAVVFNGTNATYTASGTMNVSGNLTLGDAGTGTMTGGTINATGSTITINNNGYSGSTLLKLNGGGAQAFTASGASNNVPGLQISNAVGPVTFTNGATYILTDIYNHSGAASLTLTGTTIQFKPSASVSYTFGSENFVNASFIPTATATLTLSGTMNVTGNLIVNPSAGVCTMTGGTVNATGTAINFNGTIGCVGTTVIQVAGTGSPTITDASGASIPSLTISAASGTVTFASGSTLDVTGNYVYSGAATLAATGSTIQFNNTGTSITAGATAVYNNVSINPSASATITLEDTMNVQGTLNIGGTSGTCTFNKGTGAGILNMTGLSVVITGSSSSRGCSGSGTIQMAGPYSGTTQTVTTSGGRIPNFTITANSPNSVILGSNSTYLFRGNYIHSGTATLDATTNTTTVSFRNTSATTITPRGDNYYKIIFDDVGPYTLSGTLNVTNTATFGPNNNGTINGGTINFSGSTVTFSDLFNGSVATTYSGGTATSVNTSAGANFYGFTGTLTVNKTNTLTFSNAVTFGAAMPITLTAGTLTFSRATTTTGTLTASGGAINGTSTYTVSLGNLVLGGRTYTRNGGTLSITAGSAPCIVGAGTVGAGSQSICGGTVAP